jgi:SPP1 gp7 family putative phage head morphogenesis protein
MVKILRRRQPRPDTPQREGSAIRPPYATQLWYAKEMRTLVERMARSTRREVTRLFDSRTAAESLALDASLGSQARIAMNDLTRRYDKLFRVKANELAAAMVGRVDRDNRAKFGQSLREMSGDTTLSSRVLREGALGDVTKAAIAENVSLIRSISQQYLSDVNQAVMRAITSGNGTADIIPELRKREGITLRRARIIARDQVSKTTAVVNKARAVANGVASFKWVHSGGGREPRELHLRLDGQVFRYDDPPVIDDRTGERGIPGQAINCRCVAVPVLDFDAL